MNYTQVCVIAILLLLLLLCLTGAVDKRRWKAAHESETCRSREGGGRRCHRRRRR